MNKLNESLYSSEAQDWMTPPFLVNALLKFEGRRVFDLDPCCSRNNIPAVVHYIDGQFDGLAEHWMQEHNASSLVFINPPYGDALKWWMEKCWKEFNRGCRIWALVPARTDTVYQHEYGLTRAGFTVFMKGRLCFVPNGEPVTRAQLALFDLEVKQLELKEDGTAPFPTMLLYYGNDWQDKARRWNEKPPLEGILMTHGII
jgi:hypothetical protein